MDRASFLFLAATLALAVLAFFLPGELGITGLAIGGPDSTTCFAQRIESCGLSEELLAYVPKADPAGTLCAQLGSCQDCVRAVWTVMDERVHVSEPLRSRVAACMG